VAKEQRVIVYGWSWCVHCFKTSKLLKDWGVKYGFRHMYPGTEDDRTGKRRNTEVMKLTDKIEGPVVVFPDGTHLVNPSEDELKDELTKKSLFPSGNGIN